VEGETIPNGKTGVDEIVLISSEVEFFFHTGDVGVGEVGAVEIVHEIHETTET
jgi:uncharacterized phage-like protein YoqJ